MALLYAIAVAGGAVILAMEDEIAKELPGEDAREIQFQGIVILAVSVPLIFFVCRSAVSPQTPLGLDLGVRYDRHRPDKLLYVTSCDPLVVVLDQT